jgi:hypothetical protein
VFSHQKEKTFFKNYRLFFLFRRLPILMGSPDKESLVAEGENGLMEVFF